MREESLCRVRSAEGGLALFGFRPREGVFIMSSTLVLIRVPATVGNFAGAADWAARAPA